MVDVLRALLTSFIGTLGFCILLHAPKKAMIPAAVLGAAVYMVYFALVGFGVSVAIASLAASAVGAIASQLAARKMKIVATVFLAAASIPLVPGLGLYESMAQLAVGDNMLGLRTGIESMKVILMIALGMSAGTFVFGTGQRAVK